MLGFFGLAMHIPKIQATWSSLARNVASPKLRLFLGHLKVFILRSIVCWKCQSILGLVLLCRFRPFADTLQTQVVETESNFADAKASLSLFYAQFLFLDCHLSPAARDVLKEALEKSPSLRYLWEAAIHLEEYCLESGQTGLTILYPIQNLPHDLAFKQQETCNLRCQLSRNWDL